MAPNIGSRSLADHVENLQERNAKKPELSELQQVILFRTDLPSANNTLDTYSNFLQRQRAVSVGELAQAEAGLAPEDVLNLQFTSGTTLTTPSTLPGQADVYRNHWLAKGSNVDKHVRLPLSINLLNAHC